MSIETKHVCDICGAVRGETNHWFEVDRSGTLLVFGPFVGLRELTQVCGQGCAHKLLDQFMASGKSGAANPASIGS